MVLGKVLKTLKRHTFFMLGCVAILIVLFGVGWGMSQSPDNAVTLQVWLANNALTFLLWRFVGYVILLGLCQYAAHNRSSQYETLSHDRVKMRLLGYRKWVVAMAVAYELFVVNNVLRTVIGMV